MDKYCLEMTEKQARAVITALDFYMRMRIGQWAELLKLCAPLHEGDLSGFLEKRDDAEKILLAARDILMPELQDMHSLCGSHGVYHFDDTERAYNLLRAVRSCIAYHYHPEGDWTVEFDEPRGMRGEPAPRCRVVQKE